MKKQLNKQIKRKIIKRVGLITLAATILCLITNCTDKSDETLSNTYTDPTYLTSSPLDNHSQLPNSFSSKVATNDPASMMGSGNTSVRSLSVTVSKFKVLNKVGVNWTRTVLYPKQDYWSGPGLTPNPSVLDEFMLEAYKHGIQPMLLFAHNGKWATIGDYQKWYDTGWAFADRFKPNSSWLISQGIQNWGINVYSGVNEPELVDFPITGKESYYNLLEGLADGVHAADSSLKVIPGGFVSADRGKKAYLKAIAPLFNNGKLDGIDLHKYVHWGQVTNKFSWTAQSRFEKAKSESGITTDINYYCTEFNSKGNAMTEPEAAKLFLTVAWDHLGVVGKSGQGVTQFALPWSLLHTTSDYPAFGMARNLETSELAPRAEVLKLMLELSQGMKFIFRDPKNTGIYILEGNNKKMWVWQNLKKWTNKPGTTFKITGIPESATELKVYGWDGLRNTYSLSNQTSYSVSNLSTQETYMFVVSS
ncbi:MAG: hypothetical protein AB4372_08435 [Xenococcus sp. (in: cyanobacteria)]